MTRRFRFLSRGALPLRPRDSDVCILLADNPVMARIKEIAGNRVTLETSAAPAIGARIELHHPAGGVIAANVVDTVKNGIRIAFNASDRATRFALSVMARETK